MRTWGWVAVANLLASCGDDECCAVRDAAVDTVMVDAFVDPYVEVARVSATVNRDLDVLFVIEDSPGNLDLQVGLKNAFPNFVNVLNTIEGGLPNVHLGVASTDLGTKGADDASAGPGIGSGPGSCSGNGKSGNLQTNGSTLVQGTFISDTKGTDGNRTVNYSSTLSGAFNTIASVGAAGCNFVQPAEAAKRALNNNPSNPGFRRPTAHLAVVFVGTQDDCSMSHSTLMGADTGTFGPLSPFRCTRFGVTCDVGGESSTEMATEGVKSGCHANEQSPHVQPIGEYVTFLRGFEAPGHGVYAGALVGPLSPFAVVAGPALAPACNAGNIAAAPGTRLGELTSLLTGNLEPACAADLSMQVVNIAIRVRSLIGTACIVGPLPADCHASETAGGVTTELPACATMTSTECYRLVTDPQECIVAPNLRLDVPRSQAPAPDSVVSLRCRL